MLLLRVIQTSFLLFFIGSQRSLANPTSAAYSLESSPRKLEDDDAKEKDHHWDCQADSDYVQEQISLTTKLLSDGEKVTQQQKDLSTNGAVLVLGKAGSGKTSLVQFLTDNPKLQSKKIRSNTGEYTIEDGEKIGTSATESFTLYPELVNYNSSVTFCDSPGFHDSRSSAHEIVSMDFMKSVTSRFNKVKILLLENLGSLQYGVLKDSFIDTLHYLNDFLVDIDRYKDHIVLIATKIPLTHIITDDINVTSGIVTEEMHIESIMEYLNYTEKSLAKKLDGKIGKIKKDFYQKVIKLLQSLQTRDENGKATRINIFRRPYMSGPLKNMPLLEKNKELLTRTIMNLDFVEVKKNDFDFTLSNEAKMYLECLLKLTSDNYKNRINELSFKLSEVLAQKTQNYTSYHQVLEDLESFHNALKQLSENLDETKNYNEFFDRVNGFISDQKISPRINYNEQIHVLKKYEKILLKFVDTNLLFSPSSWTLSIRQVMKSAGEELHWYKSINKFIDGLASYKMQSNKTEVYSTIFHGHFISTNGLMNLFLDITGNGNLKQFIDAQTDSKRKLELVSIANTLLQQSNITCDPNGRLIIKGLHVRIAEINLEDLVKSHCNNISVKEVAILAVETVFLDEDTIDMFRGVNMFIAAPKWEVIGQRRIVLSGQPGSEISADNPYVENGKDGKPGLPGGNGGSFFGIGLQFVNGKSLCIESNGGRGGPGANGAKGERGPAGRNGSEKIKLGIYSNHSLFLKYGIRSDDINSAIIHQYDTSDDYGYYPPRRSPYVQHCSTRTKITVIIEDGDCGGIGALGGLGGESGIGGLPGNQQMIELGDSSQIEFQKKNGETGVRGTMGGSGDRGTDGTGMICVQHKDPDYYSEPCWKCESTNTTSSACNNSCLKQNETFKYQFTTTGIEQPAPLTSPDLTSYLLDHTNFLELYANQTIFKKVISDFRESIQRKFTYTLSDLVLV